MLEEEEKLIAPNRSECATFSSNLSDYLEGENRVFVRAHARVCPACRAILLDVERLVRQASELASEEVPRTIWSNLRVALVEEGLIKEPKLPWYRVLPDFASLRSPVQIGVLAGLAVMGIALLLPPGQSERTPVAKTHVATTSAADAFLESAQFRTLVQTVGDLEDHYRAREGFFHPVLKMTYQKNLESLNVSINECLNSVRHEPKDNLAREYLLRAYTQKADLLASALEVDAR